MRNILTRAGIPYEFHDSDTPDGAAILREAGTDQTPDAATMTAPCWSAWRTKT
jgi:hypothetical protein